MYTVQAPLIARSVLGPRHYSEIWSVMMIGNSLMGALSLSLIHIFPPLSASSPPARAA